MLPYTVLGHERCSPQVTGTVYTVVIFHCLGSVSQLLRSHHRVVLYELVVSVLHAHSQCSAELDGAHLTVPEPVH